jgi:hypothetical protein
MGLTSATIRAGTVATDLTSGVYLTDGIFLYRVVGVGGSGSFAAVELEDCYGLDVVRVPAADLHPRRLRVVTPAPSEP